MKPKNGLKRITLSKEEDITYSVLFDRYIKRCKENNLSEYTIRFYHVCYGYFNKFINLSELKAGQITRNLIDDYILYLKGTGINDITTTA